RPSRKGALRRCTRTRRDSSTSALPVADGASSAAKSSSASVRRSVLLTEAHLTGPVEAAPDEPLTTTRTSFVRTVGRNEPSGAVYLVDSRMRAVLCGTAGVEGPEARSRTCRSTYPPSSPSLWLC